MIHRTVTYGTWRYNAQINQPTTRISRQRKIQHTITYGTRLYNAKLLTEQTEKSTIATTWWISTVGRVVATIVVGIAESQQGAHWQENKAQRSHLNGFLFCLGEERKKNVIFFFLWFLSSLSEAVVKVINDNDPRLEKPVLRHTRATKGRSACASAQSDQRLCCSLPR